MVRKAPPLSAIVQDDGDGTVVIVVVGEVDMSTASILAAALDAAAAADPPRLVVDMTQLGFIDASGLRTLLPLAVARRETGRPLVLRAPPPLIWRVMRALGLDAPFVVENAPRAGPVGP